MQASQVVPMKSLPLQEQGLNPGCTMNMAGDGMAAISYDDGAMADCQLEADSCLSTCAHYQSVNGDTPSVRSGATYFLSNPAVLAPIAAQYPIDHPPKRASSL